MDALRGSLTPHATMRGVLGGREQLRGGLGIGGGTTDYEEIENKPAINSTTVEGDHDGHYYGLANLSDIPDGNYSTNEVDTGLKWIDGKTIYRKTFYLTDVNAKPSDWVDFQYDDTIETLVSIDAIHYNYSSIASFGFPYITASYNHNTKYMRYYTDQMPSGSRGDNTITILYTKVS